MPELTPEDELLARDFYEKIATRDDLFVEDVPKARQLRGIVLSLLGYSVKFGRIVKKEDAEGGYTYGSQPEIKDQWGPDTAALRASLAGAGKDKTNSRKQAENTSIREAVLPENVRELEDNS